ncbi:MAG: Hsp20/alpha crystallin family protein [Planctomycetota bacterium]|jgi:HSP20 family protein
MTLMKRGRDPFAGFGNVQEAFRDMLETWPFGERQALSVADWTPSCNVSESPEEYRVEAELPGVKQENVERNVEHRVLTLRGERREEKEEKGKKYHRTESSYGSFMRSFTLPDDADEANVDAEYKDGLLTVRIPRTTPTKSPKRALSRSNRSAITAADVDGVR